MHDARLGYITTDPKNLGTALKLSVRMKLPKLSRDGRLSTLLKTNNLTMTSRMVAEIQKVSDIDEVVDAENSIVEVSSVVTLGKSEVEIAQMFVESVNRVIQAEKALENGQDLTEALMNKK
jgi:protein-arginine kinase